MADRRAFVAFHGGHGLAFAAYLEAIVLSHRGARRLFSGGPGGHVVTRTGFLVVDM